MGSPMLRTASSMLCGTTVPSFLVKLKKISSTLPAASSTICVDGVSSLRFTDRQVTWKRCATSLLECMVALMMVSPSPVECIRMPGILG